MVEKIYRRGGSLVVTRQLRLHAIEKAAVPGDLDEAQLARQRQRRRRRIGLTARRRDALEGRAHAAPQQRRKLRARNAGGTGVSENRELSIHGEEAGG